MNERDYENLHTKEQALAKVLWIIRCALGVFSSLSLIVIVSITDNNVRNHNILQGLLISNLFIIITHWAISYKLSSLRTKNYKIELDAIKKKYND